MSNRGVLYVVATPIGNLGDMTPRAVEVLKGVALIAAEDTRHSFPLLRHFGIDRPLQALHEHNEREVCGRLVERLQAGESVALVSDAGTPLVSDPGFVLVREARAAGIRVVPVPGPSAAIVALSAAGLPSDRFRFEGFPPHKSVARQERFQGLAREGCTLIFYESSHRILDSLRDMAAIFGGERRAAMARELTKLHETIFDGTLHQLCDFVAEDPNQRKGEFVVLVEGAPAADAEAVDADAERLLRLLLEELPPNRAAAVTAKFSGMKKRPLYDLALALKG